jgi:hypothetical protein
MLHPLRKLARLTPAERRLLFRAAAAVAAFRVALWVLPYRRVAALLPAHPSAARDGSAIPPARVAWAVRACARRVPGASCLTRALAARWLLAHAGIPSTLHFGWARDDDGRFHAHAWLEQGGTVLLGGEERIGSFHVLGAGGSDR